MSASLEDLLDSLATNVAPVSRHAVGRRLAVGVAIGGAVTAALVVLGLGFRPDLGTAIGAPTIWMKWGYTLSLGAIALLGVRELARPDAVRDRWLWLLALPIGLLAVVAVTQLLLTAPAGWPALCLGHSWRECSMRVVILSLPIFAGLLWSFRQFAPTRLRLTGAVAGLGAGGFAATLYGFACPETSAVFVLTWYTLGIVLASAVGALIGPRFLRW